MNKNKTAAIYDRWLSTLGGGEQVAFAYAETLKDLGYKTHLLTHAKVDKNKAEQKMGISLNNIEIIYLPIKSSKELSEFTEKYDVFINTSYLDYFPNRGKNGILSIFFPSQIYLTPYEYIKRAFIIPSFKSFFIYPINYESFKFDEYKNKKMYRWLSTESSIIFDKSVDRFSIKIFFESIAFSVLEQIKFSVNNEIISPVNKKLDHKENEVEYFFEIQRNNHNRFTIKLPQDSNINAAVVQLTIPYIRFYLYNIFKQYFPKWEMRLHGGPGITKRSELESYQKIITISEFCKEWIKKYWGLGSLVLYPPVNTNNFYSSKNKKNKIINVGRFFITGHSKKQLEQIKVFKKLYDKLKITNWEFHLVGSVHEGEKHQNYFNRCVELSKGYPIYFHTDVPFENLKKHLAESKIYWHATGLDENETVNPILFEHFGITTVEAMASGCVPVVINAGGQKEIVTEQSGFKWNSREELITQTLKLISNEKLLKRMSKASIERSEYFSRSNFKKRFEKIIDTK